MKNFLSQLNSQSSVDDILRNLNEIKAVTQETQNSESNIQTQVDNSIQSVLGLKTKLSRLDRVLNLYQAQADLSIPLLKRLFESTINDYRSAYNASVTYDKDWFANTMFSEDAKIDLAAYLLGIISSYCKDNNTTLELISNSHTDIMDYIQWPRLNT